MRLEHASAIADFRAANIAENSICRRRCRMFFEVDRLDPNCTRFCRSRIGIAIGGDDFDGFERDGAAIDREVLGGRQRGDEGTCCADMGIESRRNGSMEIWAVACSQHLFPNAKPLRSHSKRWSIR